MRLALFTETFLPQVNGVVRTIEKIVRYLEDEGHEVLIFAIGEGPEVYSRSRVVMIEGVPFNMYKELHIVKPEDKWLKKLIENDMTQTPLAILQSLIPSKHSVVEKELREFQPDLIHLATPATLGAIGIYYADLLELPCLATFHTDLAAYTTMYQIPYLEEIINQATKLIYSRVDKVLVPSPSSKKQFLKLGLEKVDVFGRGVDSVLFHPDKRDRAILEEFGLDKDRLTLVYVGRLAEEKSLSELVEVFDKLSEKYDIQLLLVGDGPIRAELERALEKSDGYFAFAGLKKGEELAKLYASADIFAFPSKTETFGQVVQEAMASGLPVAGYQSPGVGDLVEHNKTGFLAGIDDMTFMGALEKLIKSEDLRKKFGKRGRELSENRSWKNILSGLLSEYNSLMIK